MKEKCAQVQNLFDELWPPQPKTRKVVLGTRCKKKVASRRSKASSNPRFSKLATLCLLNMSACRINKCKDLILQILSRN